MLRAPTQKASDAAAAIETLQQVPLGVYQVATLCELTRNASRQGRPDNWTAGGLIDGRKSGRKVGFRNRTVENLGVVNILAPCEHLVGHLSNDWYDVLTPHV